MRTFVSTAIPYVNGDPHVGFALECVQADVLARHARLRGSDVRFATGSDEHAAKNVAAADAAGVPVAAFVAARAERFASLRETLALSTDDFVRTSTDPRHAANVERLWRACAADLFERVHEPTGERNRFFRLSAYGERIRELLESGRLVVEPDEARHEALAFVAGGLEDVSVSRSVERAHGWGILVPDDPTQVVWVWFDALANYVADADWWCAADRRVHVVGKDVARFHTVLWPAILLAAGEPLPTHVFVHGFLTVDGRRFSKSAGVALAPAEAATASGLDAFRWWLARDVARVGDTDYRPDLVALRGRELADVFGNLVNRTIALALRAGDGRLAPGGPLARGAAELPARVDDALGRFDLRSAAGALFELAQEANAHVTRTRPWELPAARLGPEVAALLAVCTSLGRELEPFVPGAGSRIEAALAARDPTLGRRLFAKPT